MVDKLEQGADGSINIGANVEIKGEIIVPGCASVDGKFEGTLKAKELVVGQSGRVSGQIMVTNAEIRGVVADNLTVQSKLTLRATGSITGTVSYLKIMVEEGGSLVGKIDKLDAKIAGTESAKPTIVSLHAGE